MARIRTIKPEFPQSESVGKISREARLLFILLFTIVDDAGRARAASRMLASLLYPYDDDAREKIAGWMLELERNEHIRCYEVDGSQYLEIVKWLEHQKIDRPSDSRLPPYRECSTKPREESRALDADLVPSTLDLVPSISAPAVAAPTKPAVEKKSRARPKVSIPDGFLLSPKTRDYAVKLGFSSPEIDREHQRFIRHAKQNDRRCADWEAAAENWFDKGAEFAGKASPIDPAIAAEALKGKFYAASGSEQLEAWDQYSISLRGVRMMRDRKDGWLVDSEWPPGYVPIKSRGALPQIAPQLQTMN